jgi:hypothetical protein
MPEKFICSNCQQLLLYSPNEYVICQNCGDVTWLGSVGPIPIKDIYLEISKRTMIPKKYFGEIKNI